MLIKATNTRTDKGVHKPVDDNCNETLIVPVYGSGYGTRQEAS